MRLTGQDPALLRRINSAAALSALHGGGALTVSEIARLVGVSRRTAEEVLDGLVARGWVAEVRSEHDQRRPVGRPPRRFRFQADAGYVIGIDIGVLSVTVAVADLTGTILAERGSVTAQTMDRAGRLSAAADACRRALGDAGVDRGRVVAAGVATTGLVSDEGTVKLATRVPEWTGLDLAGAIHDELGCPVRVENDCNVAAIAEHWLGTTRDVADVVYVQTGRQLGAGIMLGGRIHRGSHAAAGEINALPELGWAQLRDRLDELQPTADGSDRSTGPARRAAINSLIEQFGDRLAAGIAAMVLTLDPDAVVIGGTLAEAGPELSAPLAEQLAERCLHPVRVEVSTLGERAVLLGAVRIALDDVEHKLFAVDGQEVPRAAGT